MKNTRTAFPTVGDSVLSYVGHGGATHPNTKYVKVVKKGTMGRGASPTGVMASRSNVMKEYTGPHCSIQATLYKANAAEASATMRNVRIMPSATGESDFWRARAVTGQRGY